MSGRGVLTSAALLSAGLRALPFVLAAPKKQYIGRPLCTGRDAMAEGPAGARAPLAKIGYHSVESMGRFLNRCLFSSNQFFIIEPPATSNEQRTTT